MSKKDWKYFSPRCYSKRREDVSAVIQMQGGDAWGETWAELDVYKTHRFEGGCTFENILFKKRFDDFESAEVAALAALNAV